MRLLIIAAVIAVVRASCPVGQYAESKCPSWWSMSPTKTTCYRVVPDSGTGDTGNGWSRNWDQCVSYCQTLQGGLAWFPTKEDWDFVAVRDRLVKDYRPWIGMRARGSRSFTWEAGPYAGQPTTAAGYNGGWRPGEPKFEAGTGQVCVSIDTRNPDNGRWGWNDMDKGQCSHGRSCLCAYDLATASASGTTTSCTPCAAGQYQDETGQNTCKGCARGRYRSADPVVDPPAACKACGAGTYGDELQQSACKPCAAGTFAPDSSGACTFSYPENSKGECPTPTAGGGTKVACEQRGPDCPACSASTAEGEWCDSKDITSIDPTCTHLKSGQTAENNCPGSMQAMYKKIKPRCTACDLGKIGTKVAQTSESAACTSCGRGQYLDSSGKSICKGCAVNTSSAEEGRGSVCEACAPGQFQPMAGQESCKPLPSTTTNNNNNNNNNNNATKAKNNGGAADNTSAPPPAVVPEEQLPAIAPSATAPAATTATLFVAANVGVVAAEAALAYTLAYQSLVPPYTLDFFILHAQELALLRNAPFAGRCESFHRDLKSLSWINFQFPPPGGSPATDNVTQTCFLQSATLQQASSLQEEGEGDHRRRLQSAGGDGGGGGGEGGLRNASGNGSGNATRRWPASGEHMGCHEHKIGARGKVTRELLREQYIGTVFAFCMVFVCVAVAHGIAVFLLRRKGLKGKLLAKRRWLWNLLLFPHIELRILVSGYHGMSYAAFSVLFLEGGWGPAAGIILLLVYPITVLAWCIWCLGCRLKVRARYDDAQDEWVDTGSEPFVAKYGAVFSSFRKRFFWWRIVQFAVRLMSGALLSNVEDGVSPEHLVATGVVLVLLYGGYSLSVAILRPYRRLETTVYDSLLYLIYALIAFAPLVTISPMYLGGSSSSSSSRTNRSSIYFSNDQHQTCTSVNDAMTVLGALALVLVGSRAVIPLLRTGCKRLVARRTAQRLKSDESAKRQSERQQQQQQQQHYADGGVPEEAPRMASGGSHNDVLATASGNRVSTSIELARHSVTSSRSSASRGSTTSTTVAGDTVAGGSGGSSARTDAGTGSTPSTETTNPMWMRFTDGESGQPYFHNPSTGETSWTPPE